MPAPARFPRVGIASPRARAMRTQSGARRRDRTCCTSSSPPATRHIEESASTGFTSLPSVPCVAALALSRDGASASSSPKSAPHRSKARPFPQRRGKHPNRARRDSGGLPAGVRTRRPAGHHSPRISAPRQADRPPRPAHRHRIGRWPGTTGATRRAALRTTRRRVHPSRQLLPVAQPSRGDVPPNAADRPRGRPRIPSTHAKTRDPLGFPPAAHGPGANRLELSRGSR